MKIAIGCDHAGPELKAEILAHLDEDTVLAVEWSENIAEELPEDALRIDIQRIDEDSREISITAPEGDDRFEDISY